MLKRIICFGAALIMGMCIFCGCGKEPSGTFYTLQEAYDEGWISYEEVKNISYYSNNGQVYEKSMDDIPADIDYRPEGDGTKQIDYTPIPRDPEKLDAKTTKKIRKDYLEFYKEYTDAASSPWIKIEMEAIFLEAYCGKYSEFVAVKMNASFKRPGILIRFFVDDIMFWGKTHDVLLWKKGSQPEIVNNND